MTSYAELCDIAENDDILIINGKLHKAPSMAICDEGECAIIFDESKIKSTSMRIVCMAHELGHCETMSFYNEHTLETRPRMEYRANKWAINKLLPKDEMEEAMEQGYEELWELAEYFNVSEDMVKFAFWVYFDIIKER